MLIDRYSYAKIIIKVFWFSKFGACNGLADVLAKQAFRDVAVHPRLKYLYKIIFSSKNYFFCLGNYQTWIIIFLGQQLSNLNNGKL